jgi:lysozyme family protein
MADFNGAWSALVGNEGGYSNNPADPGGETMWGITKRVAVANGYTGPMRDLPLDTARAIAKRKYWDVYRCDDLPDTVAFQVLDAAYNGGYPVKWLQLAVGERPDGKLGPKTMAAVQATEPTKVVMKFLAYRLMYMTALKTWPTFGRGWANRIAGNMLKGAR